MGKSYLLWLFAGEISGDIYGARLATELKKLLPEERLRIAGMGGNAMRDAGVEIMVDSTELGVVGILEVAAHLGTFIRIFRDLKKRALREKPDAVILIDYPGFNIRFAKNMFNNGIPVIWYISPQVWAWAKWRIPKLARYCSKMLVIFPFETETYSHTKLDTVFVGHPLVDIVKARQYPVADRNPELVVLLPGSRFNEINRLFIPMLQTSVILHKKHPSLKFIVSTPHQAIYERVKKIFDDFHKAFFSGQIHKNEDMPDIQITCGETERWLLTASTGLATSGTVTIESAVSNLPLVVVYKLNPISYCIGKVLVKIPFFTMVNLIAGKEVFREYLQSDVNPKTLAEAMDEILPGGPRRKSVEEGMRNVTESLSIESKNASQKAAEAILEVLGISAPVNSKQ